MIDRFKGFSQRPENNVELARSEPYQQALGWRFNVYAR